MHNYTKIGKVLHHFLIVHSTNDVAKDMLSKTKPSSGSVILADFQSNGRGQRTNSWESDKGANILTSIILNHQIQSDHFFYLNKIVCIAIVEMLNKIIPNECIEIKWPNDILVNKKKICGILIENTIMNNIIQHSIIGIGININQEIFVNKDAISIFQITNSKFEINTALEYLFESLNNWYQNLLSYKYKLIDSVYINLLYGYHNEFNYQIENELFKGSIESIENDGSINIRNSNTDRISQFYFKQIKFIL